MPIRVPSPFFRLPAGGISWHYYAALAVVLGISEVIHLTERWELEDMQHVSLDVFLYNKYRDFVNECDEKPKTSRDSCLVSVAKEYPHLVENSLAEEDLAGARRRRNERYWMRKLGGNHERWLATAMERFHWQTVAVARLETANVEGLRLLNATDDRSTIPVAQPLNVSRPLEWASPEIAIEIFEKAEELAVAGEDAVNDLVQVADVIIHEAARLAKMLIDIAEQQQKRDEESRKAAGIPTAREAEEETPSAEPVLPRNNGSAIQSAVATQAAPEFNEATAVKEAQELFDKIADGEDACEANEGPLVMWIKANFGKLSKASHHEIVLMYAEAYRLWTIRKLESARKLISVNEGNEPSPSFGLLWGEHCVMKLAEFSRIHETLAREMDWNQAERRLLGALHSSIAQAAQALMLMDGITSQDELLDEGFLSLFVDEVGGRYNYPVGFEVLRTDNELAGNLIVWLNDNLELIEQEVGNLRWVWRGGKTAPRRKSADKQFTSFRHFDLWDSDLEENLDFKARLAFLGLRFERAIDGDIITVSLSNDHGAIQEVMSIEGEGSWLSFPLMMGLPVISWLGRIFGRQGDKNHPETPASPAHQEQSQRVEGGGGEGKINFEIVKYRRAFPKPVGGGEQQQQAMLFTDDEIIRVDVSPSDHFDGFIPDSRIPFAVDSRGRHVVQQIGTGCMSAVRAMILLDMEKQEEIDPAATLYLNDPLDLPALSGGGYEARLIQFGNVTAEGLQALARKNEFVMVGIGHPNFPGHVIIIDAFSEKENRARIRDPYHGWSIVVRADALMKMRPRNPIVVKRVN